MKLGQAPPDFNLEAASGEKFAFENHRKNHDGWHLLVFFRGNW